MKETITLGNRVMVSDPCYTLDTWCQGILDNIKPGEWVVDVEYENTEHRVSKLIVTHKDHQNVMPTERQHFEIGVDSGTAGVFDYDYYVEHHENELDEDWYDSHVCDQIDDDYFICDNKGVWSISGWGDGSYDCYVGRDKNNDIVSIAIEYITDWEEDEYEEDWEDEE